jgi:hypothetical protein
MDSKNKLAGMPKRPQVPELLQICAIRSLSSDWKSGFPTARTRSNWKAAVGFDGGLRVPSDDWSISRGPSLISPRKNSEPLTLATVTSF